MGKESPVNAVLTLLLDELKSSKTESRNVQQGDSRGFVEAMGLCVLWL